MESLGAAVCRPDIVNFNLCFMKRLLLPFLTLLLAAPVYAQSYSEIPQEYAYGSSVDVQGGLSVMPYSISGDRRTAVGGATGGNFQARYSYFFHKHWGIFASLSYTEADFDQKEYFGTVNRADGGLYRYKSLKQIDVVDTYNYNQKYNGFTEGVALQVGLAYRYDFGHWSLRPMAGVGFGSYSAQTVAYKRTPRNGSVPTAISYRVTRSALDYMDDTEQYGSNISAVLSASLQLTYTFSRHFYVSAECGFRSFPNANRYEKIEYKFKTAFDPSNWAESVAMSELEGKYVIDKSSGVSKSMRMPFNHFNFNIGIGWNLGRNRYQSGKYSK